MTITGKAHTSVGYTISLQKERDSTSTVAVFLQLEKKCNYQKGNRQPHKRATQSILNISN